MREEFLVGVEQEEELVGCLGVVTCVQVVLEGYRPFRGAHDVDFLALDSSGNMKIQVMNLDNEGNFANDVI